MINVITGDAVVFTDEFGKEHDALVTQVWDGSPDNPVLHPSVNLIHVASDPAKRDQYGSQIERRNSVPHATMQTARGMYWNELG